MRIIKTQKSRAGGRRSKKFGNRKVNVSSRSRNISNYSEKFSEKLQTLKSLLPQSVTTDKSLLEADVEKKSDGGETEQKSDGGETEQLFQETADYIVRLRTQVVLLQKLIEIYGSSDHTEDFVL